MPVINDKRNKMPELKYIIVIIFFSIHYVLVAQCDNALQFPATSINVVCGYNTISANQWAGDYNITQGYPDQSYVTYGSSVATDFLTIRKTSDNSVIAFGVTPLSIVYDVSYGNIEMHINTNGTCGTENVNRITNVLVECGCNNTFQFPAGIFSLTTGLNTIATNQWAGDYNVTTNYLDGAFCTYASTVNTDYITLRKSNDNAILKTGLTPVSLVYDVSMGDIEMHISTNAACGTENVNRTTTVDQQPFNIYTGGYSDGFQKTIALNLNPLPNIYAGGNNDGFQKTIAINQNPDCSDNIVRWSGKLDINWANPGNWDCGVLPGINSEVILQSGLDRYPTVSSSYEIKKLHLKPLSLINFLQDVVFTINGN